MEKLPPSFRRRETFVFDDVLYRDKKVEVTPSLLTVVGGVLSRQIEIDVEKIHGVWRPAQPDKQLPTKPPWWRRAAFRQHVLARAPKRRQNYNLILDVREEGRLSLCVERPDALASAICDAQMLVY